MRRDRDVDDRPSGGPDVCCQLVGIGHAQPLVGGAVGDEHRAPVQLGHRAGGAQGAQVVAALDPRGRVAGVLEPGGVALASQLCPNRFTDLRVGAVLPRCGNPLLLAGRNEDRRGPQGEAHQPDVVRRQSARGHQPVPCAQDVAVLLRPPRVMAVLDCRIAVVAHVHQQHTEAVTVQESSGKQDPSLPFARVHAVHDDHGRGVRHR